jgi:hypothetical protein
VSKVFEDAIIDQFKNLSQENFTVLNHIKKVFLCGGIIDIKNETTPSYRDRFLRHTATNYQELHDNIVLAETFKDYFKDNMYPDLLVFEEEIANISSLVVIVLESPGALVEFGMFCNKPELFKKLLVIANEDDIGDEDSFIYLGPIQYIVKKDPKSVARYSWSKTVSKEDFKDLNDLCGIISEHQENSPKTSKFKKNNSAHISLLIAEIIKSCFPILFGEIEYALMSIGLDISQNKVARHIYMLRKLNIIGIKYNGNSHGFYYPLDADQRVVNFGKLRDGKVLDSMKLRISILGSLSKEDDYLSNRRKNVLKTILLEFKKELI